MTASTIYWSESVRPVAPTRSASTRQKDSKTITLHASLIRREDGQFFLIRMHTEGAANDDSTTRQRHRYRQPFTGRVCTDQ